MADAERCASCGAIIPEGRQICPNCERARKVVPPFRQPKKYCNTCKWHDDFSWACCNGESEHKAEFMEPVKTCEKWEGKE